ncbi:MAG TPA: hypothetical protein VMI54_07165 [Polyangiaceae bacterium]|nr:hypothetical protein [Polyangiaceae bacterium]
MVSTIGVQSALTGAVPPEAEPPAPGVVPPELPPAPGLVEPPLPLLDVVPPLLAEEDELAPEPELGPAPEPGAALPLAPEPTPDA